MGDTDRLLKDAGALKPVHPSAAGRVLLDLLQEMLAEMKLTRAALERAYPAPAPAPKATRGRRKKV